MPNMNDLVHSLCSVLMLRVPVLAKKLMLVMKDYRLRENSIRVENVVLYNFGPLLQSSSCANKFFFIAAYFNTCMIDEALNLAIIIK